MQASAAHPLLVLSDIDIACRKIIGYDPSPITKTHANSSQVTSENDTWAGVGFRVADEELLIKSNYIDEIISASFRQNLSTMPGAKPWLLGLISLRGQPLSVIDLRRYVFDQPSVVSTGNRLIVIKHDNYIAGLLVEHVHGLKQFSHELKQGKPNNVFSDNITPLIDDIFNDQGVNRGSISIPQLISHQDFANAAR